MSSLKRFKVWIIGLTILVMLFLTVPIGGYFLERFFVAKLTELIDRGPESIYTYTFSNLDVRLWQGSVTVSDVGIHPTKVLLDSIERKSNPRRTFIDAQIGKVELRGIKIINFLRTGELVLGEFNIENPRFQYLYNPKKEGRKNVSPLRTIFSSSFSSATLKKLNLINGELTLRNLERKEPDFSIANINLSLSEAFADTTTIKHFSMVDYEDISMTSTGIFANISKEYHVVSDTVWFDAEKQIIRVTDFQIQPQFNRESFADRFDYQKDWMALTVDEVDISNFDFDRFSYSGEVHLGKVTLLKPNLALYKDKTKKLPAFNKRYLPASSLKRIPWPVTVDTALVKGGMITINEKSKARKEITELTFNQLEAMITGFSNNPRVQRTDQHLLLSASGRPMNAVHAELYMDFDLESKTDQFTARGRIDLFEAAEFNKAFGPGLGIRFLGGKIKDVDFHFTGMDTLSRGTIDLQYADIKLEIQKSDVHDKAGFLSMLANVIIKSNNDPAKTNYTQGIIASSRDQTKGIFPFIWHSIRSGLISTFVPFSNSKGPNTKAKVKK